MLIHIKLYWHSEQRGRGPCNAGYLLALWMGGSLLCRRWGVVRRGLEGGGLRCFAAVVDGITNTTY